MANIGGEIAQYGLTQWWVSLTDRERSLLISNYNPTYVSAYGGHVLVKGNLGKKSHDIPAGFLMTLSSWLHKSEGEEKRLAIKLANHAWELRDVIEPVVASRATLSRHFALGRMCEFFYVLRDDPVYFERAMECARLQIEMEAKARRAFKREFDSINSVTVGKTRTEARDFDLPIHHGYKRMAIVLEKEKRYGDALKVIREARHKGWNGDWDKREERIEKRLAKTK